MGLQLGGYIELPPHRKAGGFDHAAVHSRRKLLYVAHTANDAVDVIDCAADRYLYSIPNLPAVAGALVSEENDLVFTSNRGENTVGVFAPEQEADLIKLPVGVRPNGLAYDPGSGLLLAAHLGSAAAVDACTVMLVDVRRGAVVADIAMPGRTRWTVFDTCTNSFYVNIQEPALIVAVSAAQPTQIARTWAIPVVGPHGLDLDAVGQRLFCACDGGSLVTVDTQTGDVLGQEGISGVPDVVFFNASRQHLYVAVADPGVIDVFDTVTMVRIETVPTEPGAKTLAFDAVRNKVYAFLPQSHRAAVYFDQSD